MKMKGAFAKIKQGLWEQRGIDYSKISTEEIDIISTLLAQEVISRGEYQNATLQTIEYLIDNYNLFLKKIGRSEKQSFVATYIKSPNELYELIFPELRQSIIRERYSFEFLSPTRAQIKIEYLIQKTLFKKDTEIAYVFTPESHLYMLDVFVDSRKIGLVPHPKLKQHVISFFSEEVTDLTLIIEEADRKTNKNPKVSPDEIRVLLEDCLWERRGVSPLCIDAKGIGKGGQDNLSLIEVSYIDGVGEKSPDSQCFMQKSLDLWIEYEVKSYLLPKTDQYPIWVFSKAPEKFHTQTSVGGPRTHVESSTEGHKKEREMLKPSLQDPSFSAFRLTECLSQAKKVKVSVSYDENGIPVTMSVGIPETLKRWLGLTFWVSLIGTAFPLALMVPYILAKLQLIRNSLLETSVLYLMQFLKIEFPTIAIFMLGLIITARGWLIYEETTFEPLSRKLTSLAVLLLFVLVILALI